MVSLAAEIKGEKEQPSGVLPISHLRSGPAFSRGELGSNTALAIACSFQMNSPNKVLCVD